MTRRAWPPCTRLRHEVFVVEQGVPAELEWDGKDGRAAHVLAEGAGAGRLLLGADAAAKNGGDPDTAVLGRLAVLRSARGGGVGAALVRALEDEARRLGLRGVYLEAQVHAIAFYERLGYTAYGSQFPDAGIRTGRCGGTSVPGVRMRSPMSQPTRPPDLLGA